MNMEKLIEKAHIVGPDLSNPKLEPIIKQINQLPSLYGKAVYFPDLFLKDRTESPSSFAAATNGAIVPELTAPSVGCGMGIIKTNLKKEDLTEDFFKNFYENIQDELGKHYNFFENISVWLGLRKRPLKKYDLTEEEFEDIIKYGAQAAVERYGYDRKILENMEFGGSVFTEEELKNLDLHSILPRSSFTNGRHDLGYGFKGNHFLEFQVVEDVLDTTSLESFQLSPNDVVIMYHGGGGMIPYHVGRYYANRKKNTLKQKLFLFVGKALFHFGSLDGLKNMRKRFKYYFLPHPFIEIPADSPEGKRIMLANKAALNYSYAFNIAILRRVEDALSKTSKEASADLVCAKIHNSIMPEKINGEKVLVHRHTANKVSKNSPSLISGYNNTNSYLVTAGENAEEYLFSADHGAGSVIKRMEKEGISKPHPQKFTTHIFTTKPPYKKTVSHITSEGIDYVINKLTESDIIRPLVKLRPVAVFKG